VPLAGGELRVLFLRASDEKGVEMSGRVRPG